MTQTGARARGEFILRRRPLVAPEAERKHDGDDAELANQSTDPASAQILKTRSESNRSR